MTGPRLAVILGAVAARIGRSRGLPAGTIAIEAREESSMRSRRAVPLVALMVAGLAPPPARVWDFEADEPGRVARGFTGVVGRWEVAREGGAATLAQRAENPDKTFNLALVAGTAYRDLDLSVRLRAVAGVIDQGGGIVWRARDKDNYYIARYNPLEPNLRLYKVEGGKRTQLDHADAPGDRAWHTLRITMKGREILGYLDGRKLLEAEDDTFAAAGQIGVWTKSDARSEFDDLTARDD